uniref:Uncharacterized protein n=1 Tax=Rhipicephalus microplus TaxID=6941 RepID=A0A6G5AHM7_RHIMP
MASMSHNSDLFIAFKAIRVCRNKTFFRNHSGLAFCSFRAGVSLILLQADGKLRPMMLFIMHCRETDITGLLCAVVFVCWDRRQQSRISFELAGTGSHLKIPNTKEQDGHLSCSFVLCLLVQFAPKSNP